MLVAKHTNEPVSVVKQMPAKDFISYAGLALATELAGSSMNADEKKEYIEDVIYGTDYSDRRELRNMARRIQGGSR